MNGASELFVLLFIVSTSLSLNFIFCDGNIAVEVENGNLLKMLLRLDDLLKKQEVQHE